MFKCPRCEIEFEEAEQLQEHFEENRLCMERKYREMMKVGLPMDFEIGGEERVIMFSSQ